jgi:hypothetical protein
MAQDKLQQKKQAWRPAQIVNVGGINDVTTGEKANVGEQGTNPRTYSLKISPDPSDEVDLEGR